MLGACGKRSSSPGVLLETHLILAISPGPLHAAVRQAANDAAAAIRAHDAAVQLSAGVQVETAWGKLTNSPYQGVDTDFADFPFIQLLGLSSYPYFVWPAPEQLPDDYFSRLLVGHSPTVGVVEGGWTSENFSSVTSTPARQQAYLDRDARLLDGVRAPCVQNRLGNCETIPSVNMSAMSRISALALS